MLCTTHTKGCASEKCCAVEWCFAFSVKSFRPLQRFLFFGEVQGLLVRNKLPLCLRYLFFGSRMEFPLQGTFFCDNFGHGGTLCFSTAPTITICLAGYVQPRRESWRSKFLVCAPSHVHNEDRVSVRFDVFVSLVFLSGFLSMWPAWYEASLFGGSLVLRSQ